MLLLTRNLLSIKNWKGLLRYSNYLQLLISCKIIYNYCNFSFCDILYGRYYSESKYDGESQSIFIIYWNIKPKYLIIDFLTNNNFGYIDIYYYLLILNNDKKYIEHNIPYLMFQQPF